MIIFTMVINSCNNTKKEDVKPENAVDINRATTDSIDVSINDTVIVDEKLCAELSVNNFKVIPGDYYLIIDDDHPFGIVTFNIDSKINTNSRVGIKVKIAKRYTSRCPNCHCCCGIGFRCGFVTWDPPGETKDSTDNERYLNVIININDKKMTIEMQEKIPLGEPGWEID